MNEDFFWQIIEQAWLDSPEINARRQKAIQSNRAKPLQILGDLGKAYTVEIVENLERNLHLFGESELSSFIRISRYRGDIERIRVGNCEHASNETRANATTSIHRNRVFVPIVLNTVPRSCYRRCGRINDEANHSISCLDRVADVAWMQIERKL